MPEISRINFTDIKGEEKQTYLAVLGENIEQDTEHRLVNDTQIASWNNKVDKIKGKGLSTNDYTTEEKNKLSSIESNANNFTYVHPDTHPASMIVEDGNHRFLSDLQIFNYNNKIDKSSIGAPNGVAALDENGQIKGIQLNIVKIDGSQIEQTSKYRFVTDTEISNWNNKIDKSSIGMKNGVASLDTNGQVPEAQLKKSALSAYPIGSIYMNIDKNQTPQMLFGGTWERFAKGKMIIGVDEDDNDFKESLLEGGEKKHELTSEENGPHSHNIPVLKGLTNTTDGHTHALKYNNSLSKSSVVTDDSGYGRIDVNPGKNITDENITDVGGDHYHDVTTYENVTYDSGSGSPHNNMPPYITVYMWKRIS